MTLRNIIFVNTEIYHVYNRSIAGQPIFKNDRTNTRAVEVFSYYRYNNPPLRFSHLPRLKPEEKSKYFKNLESKNGKQVEILAYSLMPNHYHLLLKQISDNGIPTFTGTFQNSYAKYFNKRSRRTGALFQNMFKAVRIETDEQFMHVARYIHLNPFSSCVVKSIEEAVNYNWSSFRDYLERNSKLINTNLLLGLFSSLDKFKSFHLDHADYQKTLEGIKHLDLDNNIRVSF